MITIYLILAAVLVAIVVFLLRSRKSSENEYDQEDPSPRPDETLVSLHLQIKALSEENSTLRADLLKAKTKLSHVSKDLVILQDTLKTLKQKHEDTLMNLDLVAKKVPKRCNKCGRYVGKVHVCEVKEAS